MGNISRLVNAVNSAGGLTVANAQLHRLREQLQQQRGNLAQTISVVATETPVPSRLPPHLGWSSDRIPTQPNRVPPQSKPQIALTVTPVNEDAVAADISKGPSESERVQTCSVHPSLLVACLKNEVAAIGRIWLLARFLDEHGRGWLTIDELRQQLTDKSSPLRIVGWRRLRQILNAGKGVFWERDDFGRLWLYGNIRVARHLGVTHFSGDEIQLPVQELLGTMGEVRNAFYTAFHCGRESSPISRATLNKVTGVPERTQRHYDDVHNTERVANFSLVTDAGDQETAWQHGRAAFTFTDRQGKQGRAGASYTAIRLPNSYNTTRYARLTGKRKRLNHKLKQDLANYGTQGNSNGQIRRLFFTDGKQAGRVFGRNNDIYLHAQQNGTVVFWAGWLHG